MADHLLLETGDALLLETGDFLLLESSTPTTNPPGLWWWLQYGDTAAALAVAVAWLARGGRLL